MSLLSRFFANPRFYLERELGSLGPLMRRPAEADGDVCEIFRALSLCEFDRGRSFLIPVDRVPELLGRVDDWSRTSRAAAWWVPSPGAPRDVEHSPPPVNYLKLRSAKSFRLWIADPKRTAHESSFRFEVLDSPPSYYRNRFPEALIRDVPKASSDEIFAEYAERFQRSTMTFHGDVDFVLTWVNGNDPKFKKHLLQFREEAEIDWDRYLESDELRYALRSIFYNAPWHRRVFVVSNCDPPSWFVPGRGVTWIGHESLIPASSLPTFNSHVIEAHLFDIEGLSEHFVYLNDDMFLADFCPPSRFFTSAGLSVAFLETCGNVDGYRENSVQMDAPWQHAARRAAALILEEFGRRPGQHHSHCPYSLRVSVGAEMRQRFSAEFKNLQKNRFRASSDIPPTSFLYPHYSIASGAGVGTTVPHVHAQRHNFGKFQKQILTGRAGAFLCLNDGGTAERAKAFDAFKRQCLDVLFPAAAPWEKGPSG